MRLCDGRQSRNLIIHRELSRGYCKTAVSRWPSHNFKTMTAKEQASSLVEYFWTDVEEFKQYETIKMTKEMARDCAIKVAEEAKIEIGNFDRTDGFVKTREDFWDAVIVEIRSM